MKYKWPTQVLILLASLALSGCSWIYNFNIINNSKETVTVSYKILPGKGIFLESPMIEKNGMVASTHKISYSDSIIQFDLHPGEKATIAQGFNTSLKKISERRDGYYAENINLEWLRITRNNKVKEYTLDNIENGLTTNKVALSEIRIK